MEQLKSFLDNELDLAQKAEVETHLNNDPELVTMATEFKAISASLKEVDTGKVYGFEAMKSRLAAEETSPSRKPTFFERNQKLLSNSFLGFAAVMAIALVFFPSNSTRAKFWGGEASVEAAPSGSSIEMEVPRTGNAAKSAVPPNADTSVSSAGTTEFSDKSRQWAPSDGINPMGGTVSPGLNTPFETPRGIYLERSGTMQVRVEDLLGAQDQVSGIVRRMSGFETSTSMTGTAAGGRVVMQLRIPTKNFDATLTELRQLGELVSMSKGSQDISAETVDSVSRTQTYATEEARLIRELANARNSEKWAIRNQLTQVRAQLNAYREVAKNLKDRAAYSTVDLLLISGDTDSDGVDSVGSNWSKNSWKSGMELLGGVGRALGTAGIFAFTLAPVWIPLLIGVLILRRRPTA